MICAWLPGKGWPQTGLIVNTTPLGMSPHPDASPWPDGLPFPQGAAVYDLVYNPRETLFIRAARCAGLPAANGLGMLVEQAALSFELWTARPAPREVMYNAVGGESGDWLHRRSGIRYNASALGAPGA